jgi:hypothetical protein
MSEYFEPISVLGLGPGARTRAPRRRHAAPLVPRARRGRDQLRGRSGEVEGRRRYGGRDRRRARAGLRALFTRPRRVDDRHRCCTSPTARSRSASRRSCRRSR